MYLGYQGGKIKFYTESEIDAQKNNIDRVEYTEDEYILVGDEYILKTDEKAVNQAKEAKIIENDTARDEALNQGVIYKNVLFDSDTDQKVNLLAMVSAMDDEQTIVWYGKDNQPLECDKQDLINIGGLITLLHSFCWNQNAMIKKEINKATTIEAVESIEINYEMEG